MHPAIRYADVVLAVGGAVIAIAVGGPVLGLVLGAAVYTLARVLEATQDRVLRRVDDPRRFLGARLFVGFGRVWLYAAAIVVSGVAGQRKDGLAAALVIFGAYSVALFVRLMSGPPERSDTP